MRSSYQVELIFPLILMLLAQVQDHALQARSAATTGANLVPSWLPSRGQPTPSKLTVVIVGTSHFARYLALKIHIRLKSTLHSTSCSDLLGPINFLLLPPQEIPKAAS